MNSSTQIATLAAALVEAQKEFTPALKQSVNPQFKSKYVDLASAIESAQPALLKNGIAVLQGAAGDVAQQSVTITTRLLHSSGEWIEDSLTLPAVSRNDFTAQSAGSAITYARRYSYMAILGFAPEDDDGNGASNGHQDTQRAARPVSTTTPDPSDDGPPIEAYENDYDAHMQTPAPPVPKVRKPGPVITEAQAKRFFGIAMGSGKTKEQINNYVAIKGYAHSSEFLKSEYEDHCAWAAAK